MSEQISLKDQLKADLKASMKAKDKIRKNTVTMIRADILQVEKDNKIELDDAGVTDVLSRQLKQRRDSLADFEKGGREDLVEQTRAEIDVIEGYLPKQLSEEEIEAIVDVTIAETGASSKKDMGMLMKTLMPKVKGIADGKTVSKIVGKKLS
jgi:uncharacterized protein YqeY